MGFFDEIKVEDGPVRKEFDKSLIPTGKYKAKILEAKVNVPGERVTFKYEILDGDHSSRWVWGSFFLNNEKGKQLLKESVDRMAVKAPANSIEDLEVALQVMVDLNCEIGVYVQTPKDGTPPKYHNVYINHKLNEQLVRNHADAAVLKASLGEENPFE